MTLDKLLNHRCHLQSLRKKLPLRIALLKQMAGKSWDPALTLCARQLYPWLVLLLSTTAWCRSEHTYSIDVQSAMLNKLLLNASVLPLLTIYHPPDKLSCTGAAFQLSRRPKDPDHFHYSKLNSSHQKPSLRLKSLSTFVPSSLL